ncbi:MAG: Hsp20/alpha crystallin family protein [Gammaproteobacteria bacterium]|nr:Hsp20/alpha crystallin family protein [Gammaproteobacteria bacterium]
MTNETASNDKSKQVPQTSAAHPLARFHDIERVFDSLFRQSWLRPLAMEWPAPLAQAFPFNGHVPKVNVIDREAEVVVRAEIPGVDKQNLDVSVGENNVTIKGSTRHEEKEEKGDYYRHELSEGSFSRTVELPTQVDGAKARTQFKDGVLELILPKIEKAKRHSVKIQ